MNLRVCIDGGRRSDSLGALGFAIYSAGLETDGSIKCRVLLRGGRLRTAISSAFLAEALALEWALECLVKLVDRIHVAVA